MSDAESVIVSKPSGRRVAFSTPSQPTWMIDGAGSMSDTYSPTISPYQATNNILISDQPSELYPPAELDIGKAQDQNNRFRRAAFNTPRSKKTRLPWLDGSQSRKGSLPTAPGAFVDDHEGLNATTTQPIPVVNPQPAEEAKPQSKVSEPIPSPAPQTIRLDAASMKEDSRPAMPLIALARELYLTDSSAAMSDSETERSIRGGRRRALEDPTRMERSYQPQVSQIPIATLDTRRKSRFNEAESLSPLAPATRRQTEVSRSPSLGTRVPASGLDRRPSTSVQPLRSKKVTITPDDLTPEARLNRNQSLSIQPLKSRGWSRSFQEDLKSDYVQKKRPQFIGSESQAERSYRKSIAGLENLMQEAVKLAKDAAEEGRSNEVPAIMNGARLALERATTVNDDNKKLAARAARTMQQQSSQSSSSRSTCSSESSGHATTHLGSNHLVHHSVHPALRVGFFVAARDGPTSEEASTVRSISPVGAQAVWDEDYPHHRIEAPTRADDPKTVDFAFNQQTKSSAVDPSSDRAKTREGLKNQQRPPAPTRTPTTTLFRRITPPVAAGAQEHPPEPTQVPPLGSIQFPAPPRRGTLVTQTVPGLFEGTTSPSEPGPTVVANDNPTPDPVVGSTVTRRATANWGRDKYDENDFGKTMDLRGKNHVTLKDNERFSIHHGHRRQPIARNWSIVRKRFVATVTCLNTALIGLLIGVYAGEVPAIQYTLADLNHQVILGNVYLYIGMAITTFLFWPLPLLHGRKPYTLVALGLALPLQIPQAIIVQERRSSTQNYKGYISGLLLSRALLGVALGFAHINSKSTLLDLFGASLQSEFPHGEVVISDDIRRHGGGMGYWLGIWSVSFLGSISLGFLVGAEVISGLNQAWGFYICTILLALALFINVITPETRRSAHRRTMQEVELPNDSVSRRVARGEVKMHVTGDGPKWWWEEVLAGVYLSIRMLLQSGFLLMALYMGWIYAQIVLIIVLLGNLLSAEYRWRPGYVGLGVLSIGIGALLAVPNSKANFFSKSRVQPPRTDSMTLQPRFAWTSHLVRRALFMTLLPAAGIAYTLASKGHKVQYMIPIVFAALIGYISNLAIAECNGIIMETFDTSDLQPGTNSRHRLQSLQVKDKRRRTMYTSYPRVAAGLFTAQTFGFLFAAAATGVGGAVTRRVGAQKATAITAGVLFGLTLLLVCALVRYKVVQVIPNELFGQYFGSADAERRKSAASMESDKSWRAVVIGNPSGKNRKMSWLELGSLSRWTEIRRLNRLLNRSTTQGLNPGWQ